MSFIKKPYEWVMNLLRKLYNWVLHWADTKYGVPALALNAFSEASFFPVPPDALLIALCVGKPKKSYIFALYCSIFSVLGGILGYLIGLVAFELAHTLVDYFAGEVTRIATTKELAELLKNNLITQDVFNNVKNLYVTTSGNISILGKIQVNFYLYGAIYVFVAGFTPIPYKIFTIASGIFGVAFVPFVIASLISRALRFYLVATLIFFFGEKIKSWIDKYFNWAVLIFTALLIGFFFLIKYIL